MAIESRLDMSFRVLQLPATVRDIVIIAGVMAMGVIEAQDELLL